MKHHGMQPSERLPGFELGLSSTSRVYRTPSYVIFFQDGSRIEGKAGTHDVRKRRRYR